MSNKKNPIQDERLISEIQKVTHHGFYIMCALLFLSLFIKLTLLDLPFKYSATELIIFLVGVGYVTIRTMLDGNLNLGFKEKNNRKSKLKLLSTSVISGIVFSIVIGITNYIKYDFALDMLPMIIVPLFIQFTIMIFVIYWIGDTISHKRMEKKLNDLEN